MLLSSKDLHKQARAFLGILMPAGPASASLPPQQCGLRLH